MRTNLIVYIIHNTLRMYKWFVPRKQLINNSVIIPSINYSESRNNRELNFIKIDIFRLFHEYMWFSISLDFTPTVYLLAGFRRQIDRTKTTRFYYLWVVSRSREQQAAAKASLCIRRRFVDDDAFDELSTYYVGVHCCLVYIPFHRLMHD